MNQEFRLHIELETEKLMRERGLSPDEARRLALVAFGGVETHKEALRDGRGFAWLGGFSLDLRLAIRMLAEVPVADARGLRRHGIWHRRRRGRPSRSGHSWSPPRFRSTRARVSSDSGTGTRH